MLELMLHFDQVEFEEIEDPDAEWEDQPWNNEGPPWVGAAIVGEEGAMPIVMEHG